MVCAPLVGAKRGVCLVAGSGERTWGCQEKAAFLADKVWLWKSSGLKHFALLDLSFPSVLANGSFMGQN